MTEQEWLSSENPTPMWWLVEPNASKRKLRLVACACCRRIWHLFANERSRRVIEVAEKVADGSVSETIAAQLLHQADQEEKDRIPLGIDEYSVARSALVPHDAVTRAVPSLATSLIEQAGGSRTEEARRQTDIVRDVFGNPFRLVAKDSSWLTSTVVALAQAIYDERAFDRLPILADALEDAGCTNQEMLAHCRGPGPHTRGCWVVDLLAGKE